jgi:cardiolipin synthase
MSPSARALGAALLVAAGCRGGDAAPRAVPAQSFESRLEDVAGAPFVGGNAAQLLENSAVFDAIVRDIAAARRYVHVVTFIWRGETGPSRRVTDALLRRAKGVACRILVDPFGSLKLDPRQRDELTASGCELRQYGLREDTRPTARNHRKFVVVDGEVGITGGFGFHVSWEGNGLREEEWRDTAVRVRGPVVAQIERAFEHNWSESGGTYSNGPPAEVRPAGDERAAFVASSPRGEGPSAAERMTHLLVSAATRRLWIANSYFVPDEPLRALLVEKARQGVEIRVLAAGAVHDVKPVRAAQRETYGPLLEAGIRIYEYRPSMMHAKTILVDDHLVAVGSTNIDALSFDRLEEGSLVVSSRALAEELERHLRTDLERSDEITLADWERRPPHEQMGQEAASFFSEWM